MFLISPVRETRVLTGVFGAKSFRGISLLITSCCLPPKGRDSWQVRGLANEIYVFFIILANSIENLPIPFTAGFSVIIIGDFVSTPSG